MAGLKGAFFDTSVLIAGTIDFGHSSQDALLLMDAVADGRIERPSTAWHCCLEYYWHAGARLVATENRRHFTSLLRHSVRVLVSAELVNEIGR